MLFKVKLKISGSACAGLKATQSSHIRTIRNLPLAYPGVILRKPVLLWHPLIIPTLRKLHVLILLKHYVKLSSLAVLVRNRFCAVWLIYFNGLSVYRWCFFHYLVYTISFYLLFVCSNYDGNKNVWKIKQLKKFKAKLNKNLKTTHARFRMKFKMQNLIIREDFLNETCPTPK